jgi:eukaryotic-like serine/threonine-protein kinase
MITHDKWPRIKEIFQAAQGLGAAERVNFLNQACAGDESIRADVEALLTADASNEDFLSAPAYEFAAGILAAGGESEFAAGTKVGRYTILCPLGAGGMGQIYLAEDAQLGRKIALKLISPEFATDPRRVYRFEQEARAASALNHPNVCIIHEIAVTDAGRHFIAMEYIQGITLRDQLSRGALTVYEALNIAVQVGAALSSAHASRIIHRDIKPENIMLRPDGYVKVLDFGLAKLTEVLPESPRLHGVTTTVLTEAGTLMGTVKYMSPEQLRKGRVDERTDIWSLGIVLYEMLTGVTPFEAQSSSELVDLILEPRPTPLLPAEFPHRLQEIVRKALEKDRDFRYQTITRLASDLKTLQMEWQRQEEADPNLSGKTPDLAAYGPHGDEQKTRKVAVESAIFSRLKSQAISTADFLFSEIRSHKTAALFTGGTGILAFLLLLPGAVRFINNFINPATAPQQTIKSVAATDIKALTNAGTSVCSAISSDGKLVAHAEEQGGRQRLVVTSTATFAPSTVVAPAEVQYLGISFSRDNNYLYFTRRENSRGILYRLALPGSAPVRVKDSVDSPISFSPQGDQFAFVRHDQTKSEYSLMRSDVDGGNEQTIATRRDGDKFSVYGLAWSPDGSMIVCPSISWAEGHHVKLMAFALKDGREFAIGDQWWFSILQLAWQDDMNSLVVSARELPTTPNRLWRITYPSGSAQRITDDLGDYTTVSLAGDNIVAVRTDPTWRIWVASLDDSARAKVIASGVGLKYGLSWTGRGNIVYSSMVQDRLNISRVDADGSNQVQLTANAGDNYNPVASADGRFVVFASNRINGRFNIWRMNTEDGSDAKEMTLTDGNFYPSVSPDNQWIAYENQLESKMSVWKVPLQGGEPVKVAENYRMPAFSPDSRLIAARYHLNSGSRDLAIFSAEGGEPLRQLPIPVLEWQRVQWLDGHTLSYIKNVDGYSNIWSYDLDSGVEKQLTNFNSDQIYAYSWSPDFKQVACQRGTVISNVTIISSER